MKLVVVSHKLCWPSTTSRSGFATDGGFPVQIAALSELFANTIVLVPCEDSGSGGGTSSLEGSNLTVVRLSVPVGRGLRRKLSMPLWLLRNGSTIWREVRGADAVHTPIPGDVGTIGMLCALLCRKPLFVRHCGNWFVQKTIAERFWKWMMEYFGGGKNVMLATGGSSEPPSRRNENIRWIFSTSLRRKQILENEPRRFPENGEIRLITVCRQEPRKGTDVVIQSIPYILKRIPNVSLDVVGDGSELPKLKMLAQDLGLIEYVRFHGKLEQRQVLSLLNQSHLFCFPTSASEGFPKAVLEALASGLPVVTTRVSVLPELMKLGGGLSIRGHEPSEFADAIIGICTDKKRYLEMSTNAVEIAKRYSLEEWQERIGENLRNAWGVPSLL